MLCKKIKNACCVNATACTIVERFERPWQSLKGISIKNTYFHELIYIDIDICILIPHRYKNIEI
jgi:hypothetical protein